jgi:hypothetical protein
MTLVQGFFLWDASALVLVATLTCTLVKCSQKAVALGAILGPSLGAPVMERFDDADGGSSLNSTSSEICKEGIEQIN